MTTLYLDMNIYNRPFDDQSQMRIRLETMLTDQRFDRSEQIVRETGFVALVRSLGYGDALRFLAQLSSGQGHYLEWQDRVFGDAGVDEIYEQGRENWEARHE